MANYFANSAIGPNISTIDANGPFWPNNNRERPICILQDPNSHEPNLKIESDRKALYKKKKEKEKNKFSIKICKITSSMFKIKFTFLYKRNKNHRNNKN